MDLPPWEQEEQERWRQEREEKRRQMLDGLSPEEIQQYEEMEAQQRREAEAERVRVLEELEVKRRLEEAERAARQAEQEALDREEELRRQQEEFNRQADERLNYFLATMLVTNLQFVPGIQKIHGVVRTFNQWLNIDFSHDMESAADTFEFAAIEKLKLQVLEKGGNALIGLVINTQSTPVSYNTTEVLHTAVHLTHTLSISAYGTAVTIASE